MCSNRDMDKRSLVRTPPELAGCETGFETCLPSRDATTADEQPAETVWSERARHETPACFIRLMATVIGCLGLSLSGCGRPADDGATGPAPATTLRLVDHDGLMKEVASHLGKVVVLDCWSTSCPPCVKEFPGLVALAERHGNRVACLSLAFDYDGSGKPEDLIGPIQAFLEKTGAGRVRNLLSSEPADSLYGKLDLTSVPAVYVWKPNGERAIRYDDDFAARELGRPFTYEDVEQTVTALLEE
jgi:thiol-disulfide isomerase/thioredoxin